ncbi:MAG TPA: hypothetical protein VGC54_10515 [Planctomycetota bacterium]
MNPTLTIAAVLTLLGAAPLAAQEVAYYVIPVHSLELEELEAAPPALFLHWSERDAFRPRVALEGPGEAWLRFLGSSTRRWQDQELMLAVSAPKGATVRGRIFLPNDERSQLRPFRFVLPPESADPFGEFAAIRQEHLRRLWESGVPGAAWFRHLAGPRQDLPARGGLPSSQQVRQTEFEQSFSMFTGGRALAENLQLDRDLLVTGTGESGRPIAEIDGVTLRAHDFKAALKDLGEPVLDPLAAWIPQNQHAVFFSSFAQLVAVADELERRAAPLLQLAEPRGEHASTRARYERQLCVGLDETARAFGSGAVDSLALTGSDPYLRTGSDVALLFLCKQPDLVLADLRRRQERAVAEDGASRIQTEIAGVPVHAVRTPGRTRDSWVARSADVVIVANSAVALQRVLDARAGRTPALATAEEYRFFRHRYPQGDEHESAFLMLTDAAIRRWASPRWRILASRRTRAAATLAEYQARAMPQLAAGFAGDSAVAADPALPDLGTLVLESGGVRSAQWGSLAFLTPIAELPVGDASSAEIVAYEMFRRRFQAQWDGTFDPVAAVIDVGAERVRVDLSVVPLTIGSDYRDLAELTRGVLLKPGAGDAHPDALLQWTAAVNRESATYRDIAQFFTGMGIGVEPMDWVGDDVSLYADPDPFWDEYVAADDRNAFLNEHLGRLPVAVRVAGRDPLRMAVFLTALRAFAESAAPGLVRWENRLHGETAYVRLNSDEIDWAIHYAALPDGWTLSFSETMIQHAIDRWVVRQAAPKDAAAATDHGPAPAEGEGDHLIVRARPGVFPVLEALWSENVDRALREASWGNLPILNEWRRLYPGEDAVALHERAWKTRLICPGGGVYVWNAEWLTYESTVYGHPGQPKRREGLPGEFAGIRSGEFGLNFDGDGLRARAVLERD